VSKRLIATMVVVVGVVVLHLVNDWQATREAAAKAKAAAEAGQRYEVAKAARIAACRERSPAALAASSEALKRKQWTAAVEAVRECAALTGDAGLVEALAAGEISEYRATAGDVKKPLIDRLIALEGLYRDHSSQYTTKDGELYSALKRRDAGEVAARRRREGVAIGMSQEDVLASAWGRPRSVNRTTYSWGVKEQWVYDGGYLYFTDGVLVAISN
jgi:hypothetical protein